jgi:hypothetical protein
MNYKILNLLNHEVKIKNIKINSYLTGNIFHLYQLSRLFLCSLGKYSLFGVPIIKKKSTKHCIHTMYSIFISKGMKQ